MKILLAIYAFCTLIGQYGLSQFSMFDGYFVTSISDYYTWKLNKCLKFIIAYRYQTLQIKCSKIPDILPLNYPYILCGI